MKNKYEKLVREHLERSKPITGKILTLEDLAHLPQPVQKYIIYSGAVGKEKVVNFRAECNGGIRSKPGDDFMPLRSEQYNFTNDPARFFYIVARKMGIPAKGLHLYSGQKATMKIKIAGLFTMVDAKGEKMDQAETVTIFNDMCFLAPGSLIDRNIEWITLDESTVQAKYTNGRLSIGATLHFNEKGELINFISNDRFETTDGKIYKNYPWATPVTGYREMNGFRMATGAKLIYQHPDEDFCYGEFNLVSLEYNCQEFR